MSLNKEDTKVCNSDINTPEILVIFKNGVNYILKKWWVFTIAGMLGGAYGIIYYYIQTPEYKSQLLFALDDGNSSGNGLALVHLASQFGFTQGNSNNIFSDDNILEIIKSRRIIESALLSVDTFNNTPYTFIEYYLKISEQRKYNSSIVNIHFPTGQLRSSFSYQQDSLLYKIGRYFADKYILAKRLNPKLSLYQVNILSLDEKFTKDFTERIIQQTNAYYIEVRTSKSKIVLNSLEGRVEAMKENLNSSLSKSATVKDVNIHPAFSAGQIPVQKEQIYSEVFEKAFSEMFKSMEFARFQFLNKTPLMQIIDGAEYPMQKIQFGKWNNFFLFSVFSILLVMAVMGLFNIFSKGNPAIK